MIRHLHGPSSLRRTAEEVTINVAYRWFLYTRQEETPHLSTVSCNFRHRVNIKLRDDFLRILNEEHMIQSDLYQKAQ